MKTGFHILILLIYSFGLIHNCDASELNNSQQPILQDTSTVNSLNKLAASYILSSTDSTLFYADSAVQLAQRLAYDEGEAFARRHKAQAYIYSGLYKKAMIEATTSLDLFKTIGDEVGRANVLNKIGEIHMYKGDYDLARITLIEAKKVLEQHEDFEGLASSFNALGNIAQKKGDYPQASEYLYEALRLNQQIGKIDGVADALNNLGVIHEYQEEYDKALSNYHESYLIYRQVGDKIGEAIGLHNAGIILKKTKLYDSAIYNFKKALALDMSLGALDGVAYDKKELGETFLLLNMIDTAYMYLHGALKLSIRFKDPVVEVPTLHELGKFHRYHGDYDSAEYYFKTSFENADEFQMKNEKKEVAKSLYSLYDERKDVKNAYRYYQVYQQLKDTLFNEQNIKKLTLLEAEYEFEKSRKDDELNVKLQNIEKDREIAQAIWIRNSSIAGFLVILIVAVLLFVNYRRKKRANDILHNLNTEVNKQKEELSIQTDELAELNEKLRLLNSTLEEKVVDRTSQLKTQNEQLQVKNSQLSSYAFYNAHKLRAPLASVMGLVNLFVHPSIDSQEQELIANKIVECSNQLNEVVKQMQELLDKE